MVDPADHFAGIWDTNVLDGEVYGVPWYVDTRVLFYRSDLLAAAGHPEPPTTWTEWRIPYTDLAGINLSRVAIMYIGLGDRDNPTAGGTGLIFIDDIGYGKPATPAP